jgi:hypothetical protein
MSMSRQLITRTELLNWLTTELRRVEGLEQRQASGGAWPLQEPDQDGCNWSSTVQVSCGEAEPLDLSIHLSEVIRQARARFNLK